MVLRISKGVQMYKKMVSKIILLTIILALIIPAVAFACDEGGSSDVSLISYVQEKVSGFWNQIFYSPPDPNEDNSSDGGILTDVFDAAKWLSLQIYEGFVGFFSSPDNSQA